MQINATFSRRPRETDWIVKPLAKDVADILNDGDIPEDKVLVAFDHLQDATTHEKQVKSLQPIFQSKGWNGATYGRVALSLKKAFTSRPSLPGRASMDYRGDALQLIRQLTPIPTVRYTTPHQLESLGYDSQVAENLFALPGMVNQLERWTQAEPKKAQARDLYRALALEGGMKGYDAHHVGTVNGEIYFGESSNSALYFGKQRVAALEGTKGVMLHCQIPGFMVENSPPQGGDAVWPILRPRNMPDPQRPNLGPFIARVGEFEAHSSEVEWRGLPRAGAFS